MATRMHPCLQVRVGESSVPADGRRGWLSSRVGQSWVEAADGRVWPVGRTGWGGGWLESPVSPGQCPRPLSWSAGCEGACLRQQWGGHHQPARQHPAEHRAAQQAARQHPPGQRGAAQPRREGGECGPWPKPAAPGLVCMHRQSRGPVLSPRGPVTFCSVARSYISSMPQYLRKRKHRFPVRFSALILDLSVHGDGEWREAALVLLVHTRVLSHTHALQNDTLCRAGWALCLWRCHSHRIHPSKLFSAGVFGVFTSLAASSTSGTFCTPRGGPSPSASPLYPLPAPDNQYPTLCLWFSLFWMFPISGITHCMSCVCLSH